MSGGPHGTMGCHVRRSTTRVVASTCLDPASLPGSASAKTPTDVPRRGRSGVVNNPGGKGPIEKRDGDWICRNCGKLVFATKAR